MANKQLFASLRGRMLPATDAVNAEGARTYRLPPKQALAQFAATGCVNGTYYADEATQLSTVLNLSNELDGKFIAQVAIYARERGRMKDTPALLTAVLSVKAPEFLPAVFARVVDNGRMLRNFVQILRSGAVGRKSLGTRPKRLVQKWLDAASDEMLLAASVGNDPSLADIIKMVHPRPVNPAREAFYGWLIGNKVEEGKLPLLVQAFEAFKRGVGVGEVPAVDFRLLSGLPLKREHWMVITEHMGWTATRMNLNTLARHGVFRPATRAEAMAEVTGRSGMTLTERVAARLRNPELIEKARAFPYQILIAHRMASDAVPVEIKEALQDALEIAVDRTPAIEGKVVVLPDVSGSMGSPVTGFRQGATTAVSCREVAALVTAAVLRRNPRALVLPFDNRLWRSGVNGRDSLATNTARLAALGGGGTDCSLPLRFMNQHKAEVDLVLMISDNQSWIDNRRQGATEVMAQWEALKQRNPQARLACLDLQPYDVTVASERDDILNIGGFSDAVFEVIAKFARYELDPGHWVKEVEGIEL